MCNGKPLTGAFSQLTFHCEIIFFHTCGFTGSGGLGHVFHVLDRLFFVTAGIDVRSELDFPWPLRGIGLDLDWGELRSVIGFPCSWDFLEIVWLCIGDYACLWIVRVSLAYCIARSSKSWQQWLLILVMIPFWTNFLVRTYAWVLIFRADGVVNGFLKILGQDPISLLFTDFSVCVGLVYGYLPFMVLPLVSALERIPIQVEEAARDLFATRLEALWHVVVPLSRPGWVAGSVLVFIPSLGAFITPYLLGGGQSLMIGTLIQQEFLVARDWPFGAALSFGLMAVILMLWGWLGRKPEEQSMI